MKRGRRIRIFWIIMASIMLISMIVFTIMPFFNLG